MSLQKRLGIYSAVIAIVGVGEFYATPLYEPVKGHLFYPSSQWETGIGPIQQYVLADLYAWLEAHSGLSHSYVTTSSASAIGANTSSLNTNTTSP